MLGFPQGLALNNIQISARLVVKIQLWAKYCLGYRSEYFCLNDNQKQDRPTNEANTFLCFLLLYNLWQFRIPDATHDELFADNIVNTVLFKWKLENYGKFMIIKKLKTTFFSLISFQNLINNFSLSNFILRIKITKFVWCYVFSVGPTGFQPPEWARNIFFSPKLKIRERGRGFFYFGGQKRYKIRILKIDEV